MNKVQNKAKIYIISIYIITFMLIATNLKAGYINLEFTNIINIVFFSILVLLTETLTVYFKKMSFSTSFAITLAIYILWGSINAIFIMIVGFSLRIIHIDDKKYKHIFNTPFYGTLFNYCILTIPIIVSNYIYIKLGGNFHIDNIKNNLVYIILFSVFYFLVNTFLISIFSSIMNKQKFKYSFLENIKIVFLNILAMVPFGIIIAVVFNEYGYLGVIVMFLPTLLARYTFSLHLKSKHQSFQLVKALSRSLEARDQYTEGHSQRVADIVSMIAKELKYNEWRIEELRIASLLHDIGKIGITDNVLNKPGKLTNEEFELIKTHPQIGFNILEDVENMDRIKAIVRHHHERYDGRGYPMKIGADDLKLDVFIVQLADSVDAMATDRPYRKALDQEKIIQEVNDNCGSQFHPKVVKAYLNALKKQNKE